MRLHSRSSRRSANLVGLDIEPGKVSAAAAATTAEGSIRIVRSGSTELPGDAVRDGEVIDVEAVATAIRRLWTENKGLGRDVRIGMANAKLVVRTVEVPPVTDRKQLAAAVHFVAEQELPMPLQSAVLDFHSLGMVDTREGQRHRVLLVAARRDTVEAVLVAVRAAGLRPRGVDLSAFAMVRVLGGATPPSALYLAVGGLTNMAIVVDGVCAFTRVTGGGLEGMAMELAERRVLTLEHARMWLKHVGLEQPVEGVEGDAEIVADARAVLQDGTRRLVAEVRASVEFHHSQMHSGVPVDRVLLTGGAVGVPGFVDTLQTELGLAVEPHTVTVGKHQRSEADLGQVTVAAGLAVEEMAA